MSIEYHPAIEYELKKIIEYYNRCSKGLGAEFLDEFERGGIENLINTNFMDDC